jgi:F-type H+-transporting ATPase subunit epsilon
MQSERIEKVVAFSGRDASGSFAILPGHVRFLTVLEFGLARFRCLDGEWEYLALPGAVLYFVTDELFLSCRRFVRDLRFAAIEQALAAELAREEQELKEIKTSLHRMEEAMFKRLRELGKKL